MSASGADKEGDSGCSRKTHPCLLTDSLAALTALGLIAMEDYC